MNIYYSPGPRANTVIDWSTLALSLSGLYPVLEAAGWTRLALTANTWEGESGTTAQGLYVRVKIINNAGYTFPIFKLGYGGVFHATDYIGCETVGAGKTMRVIANPYGFWIFPATVGSGSFSSTSCHVPYIEPFLLPSHVGETGCLVAGTARNVPVVFGASMQVKQGIYSTYGSSWSGPVQTTVLGGASYGVPIRMWDGSYVIGPVVLGWGDSQDDGGLRRGYIYDACVVYQTLDDAVQTFDGRNWWPITKNFGTSNYYSASALCVVVP